MIFNNNTTELESWFLAQTIDSSSFGFDLQKTYQIVVEKLDPVHKQVNAGADHTDGTSLTWHDKSHVTRVMQQASRLLSYADATISPYEAFVLLIAIQIHDIGNSKGRSGHESNATSIFHDLGIPGLIDSILLKNISYIVDCHSGSITKGQRKDRDKIQLLKEREFKGPKEIRLRYLAALLRLADEYSDDAGRAMKYLLAIGKIQKQSVIHQKHAECLLDVLITPDANTVELDYRLTKEDALVQFPKVDSETNKVNKVYILDEIFERTVKTHYETSYCMRYLRPTISVTKLRITIEIEHLPLDSQIQIAYELEEKGYPDSVLGIIDLCGDQITKNGGHWSGKCLRNQLTRIQ